MHLLDELTSLEDAALHGALKQTAGKANALTAQLLAQLAELEARGLYRERACSSLYTYCVYELRMSEDEAQRRCRAARLTRQFPVLLQMLADSAIHLTGMLLLGPHLTLENHSELLERAQHRTKREIERLVATVAPRPDVPTLVVPLRRAGAEDSHESFDSVSVCSTRPRNTWAAFMQALAGPVRRLQSGIGAGEVPPTSVELASERSAPHSDERHLAVKAAAAPGPSPWFEPEPAGMRYHVQFTADQAYIDLLEEARDLLQHELPDRNVVEAQRRALTLLVEQLRRRKHAAVERPRVPAPAPIPTPAAPRSRHLPAALRRAVWQRDAGHCAYLDERGVRCRETAGLEYHHLRPYACGGPNSEQNVSLRCRAHNALAAEHDFGAAYLQQCQQGVQGGHRASAGSSNAGGGGGLASAAHRPSPG